LLSAWSSPGIPSWLAGYDKVAHAGLYAVLGACLGYGWRRAVAPPPHWVLIGVGMLYAATDEWHQAFVPRRVPSMGDWLADVTGVLVGYGVAVIVFGRLLRRTKPKELGVDV
jgi:VanZ family protein